MGRGQLREGGVEAPQEVLQRGLGRVVKLCSFVTTETTEAAARGCGAQQLREAPDYPPIYPFSSRTDDAERGLDPGLEPVRLVENGLRAGGGGRRLYTLPIWVTQPAGSLGRMGTNPETAGEEGAQLAVAAPEFNRAVDGSTRNIGLRWVTRGIAESQRCWCMYIYVYIHAECRVVLGSVSGPERYEARASRVFGNLLFLRKYSDGRSGSEPRKVGGWLEFGTATTVA